MDSIIWFKDFTNQIKYSRLFFSFSYFCNIKHLSFEEIWLFLTSMTVFIFQSKTAQNRLNRATNMFQNSSDRLTAFEMHLELETLQGKDNSVYTHLNWF